MTNLDQTLITALAFVVGVCLFEAYVLYRCDRAYDKLDTAYYELQRANGELAAANRNLTQTNGGLNEQLSGGPCEEDVEDLAYNLMESEAAIDRMRARVSAVLESFNGAYSAFRVMKDVFDDEFGRDRKVT